ncbi:helix-turn-helix transcriptional regulator [Peptoniphilus equinus]|uniref:Helix-turn-helix transcriptional regulator n=1 Tax=Peptoniphilus equinus TaxID=3016343 RepID=A0ABY7QWU3_9FIRM|nr:helix-turn-helix transcriptional regulator [Peptoniphilus equinus]WBW50383.1 helix-turn-helix transcriptional regulator [Peptoniphilus equinus]
MEFTARQNEIITMVRACEPITGDDIAQKLGLSRSTIRNDLSLLVMTEVLGARPKVGYYYRKAKSVMSLQTLENLSVRDMMSVPVVMDEETSIYDVIVGIFIENVSSVFISKDGFLSGVVSRKDLLRVAIGKLDLQTTPIGMCMTRMPNLVTIGGDDSVLLAAQKINAHKIDALPVVEVTPDGLKVIGRFTKTNITRIFADLASGEF